MNPIPALTNPPYIPMRKKTKHDTTKFFPLNLSFKSPVDIFGPANINKITIIIITESILLKTLSFISTAIYAPIKEPIKANKPM